MNGRDINLLTAYTIYTIYTFHIIEDYFDSNMLLLFRRFTLIRLPSYIPA